jgi:hypothetical protein
MARRMAPGLPLHTHSHSCLLRGLQAHTHTHSSHFTDHSSSLSDCSTLTASLADSFEGAFPVYLCCVAKDRFACADHYA